MFDAVTKQNVQHIKLCVAPILSYPLHPTGKFFDLMATLLSLAIITFKLPEFRGIERGQTLSTIERRRDLAKDKPRE